MTAVNAEPYEFEFDPKTTALVMIDFQRDFVDPGGSVALICWRLATRANTPPIS
jgi:hypothetical protein